MSSDCLALADVFVREQGAIDASGAFDAPALLDLFERCDALRRGERFDAVLQACACAAAAAAAADPAPAPYAPQFRLPRLLRMAMAVDTADIARQAAPGRRSGPDIGLAIRQARVARIQAALTDAPPL